MTITTTTRKIPTPLYAAAGAGDLAYEQLRKLPKQVAVAENTLRTDLSLAADRLRDVARRNTVTLLAGAQVAQDRAVAVYTDLVHRGEKVVAGGRTTEAKIEIDQATKTVTAEVAVTPTPADIAPAVTPKTGAAATPPAATPPVVPAVAPAKRATAVKKTAPAKK